MKFSCTFTDFSLPAGPSVGCVVSRGHARAHFLPFPRAYNIYSLDTSLAIEEEPLPLNLVGILTTEKKKKYRKFLRERLDS